MAKGRPGGNPDITQVGRRTQYKQNDPRAAKNGKKGRSAQQIVLKTVREIATEKLDENDQHILNGVVMRLIKMAADGNLPAIQYLIKLIGQDPGDLLTVSTPTLSEEAKEDIDRLLRETRGEVK